MIPAVWFRPSLAQAGKLPPDLLNIGLVLILVMALTMLAAILARRWQSRQALVRRLAELDNLAQVGHALAGAQLDSARLAELVFEQAGQIVETSTFQLGLFEGDRYRLLIWLVDGQRRPLAEFQLTPDSLGIIGWLRESRQSLLVRDFEREAAALPARPRYQSADPPRSAVFVPLLSRGCALGAVAIQSRRPNAFDEEHLRLLAIIANQAASAFENATLFEQAQRRATQLELLASVSQRINVLQPLPALYRQIVDLVAGMFREVAVSYYECEHQLLTLCVSSEGEGQAGPPATVRFGEGPAGQAAEQRQPVVVQPVAPYPPADTPASNRPCR